MSYNLIQGQGKGHGGPKSAKADFKVYFLRQYARYNQKTNGEL